MSTYSRSELENSGQCHQKSIGALPLSSMHAEGGAQFDFNYRRGFLRTHYSRIFFSRNPSYDEFAKHTARENFALYGIFNEYPYSHYMVSTYNVNVMQGLEIMHHINIVGGYCI